MTKRLRFEVFKRDGFKCQYCGKCPPDALLEVDHITPKSGGGEDDLNNLVTSCFDCNRGKAHVRLDLIPSSITDNAAAIAEREDQVRAYNRALAKIEKRLQSEIAGVNGIFSEQFKGRILGVHFQQSSLKDFLRKLPVIEVEEAMTIACSFIHETRGGNPELKAEAAIKYFCGICWTKIKRNQCQG